MNKYEILGPFLILLAATLWSLDGFLRQHLSSLSPLVIVFWEHLFGFLIFSPFLLARKGELKTIHQQTWVSIFWVSIVGGIGGTFFYTKALGYVQNISLSVVVLLQKLQPLFAIGLASVLLKERLTKRFILCAVTALTGAYLIAFHGTLFTIYSNDNTLIASLMAICAAFAWGSSTVFGKRALNRLSFVTLTSSRLLITSIITAIIICTNFDNFQPFQMDATQWKILIGITLSTGSVALCIYYWGLKRVPASHATIYELFWPLSAVLIDWLYRGHTLSPIQIFGSVLLLGSIIFLQQTQPTAISTGGKQ